MTHRALHFLVSFLLLFAWSLGPAQAEVPEDEREELFYSLGVMFATTLGEFQLSEEELALVLRGVRAAVAGEAAPLDMQSLSPRFAALHMERATTAAKNEKEASAAYVAKAASQSGAVQTESGLVITVLEEGSGASPKATDTVTVHYHGTLRDGSVFNSSKEGSPAEFSLDGVIACWTEGVQSMKVGGKSRLVCPADLAYGEQGSAPRIPPSAALTFEIELMSIAE